MFELMFEYAFHGDQFEAVFGEGEGDRGGGGKIADRSDVHEGCAAELEVGSIQGGDESIAILRFTCYLIHRAVGGVFDARGGML